MTKPEIVARWHILQKNLDKRGMTVELDLLTRHQIQVKIGTQQPLSAALEWAFCNWEDVRSVYQTHDDKTLYFGVVFQPKPGEQWQDESGKEEAD